MEIVVDGVTYVSKEQRNCDNCVADENELLCRDINQEVREQNISGCGCWYVEEKAVIWLKKEDTNDPVENKSTDVVLTLTEGEANTVMCIVGSVTGDSEFSLRTHTDSVYDKLNTILGVPSNEDFEEFEKHLESPIKIRFKDFSIVNEVNSIKQQMQKLQARLNELEK